MTRLTASSALHELVLPVSADARPPFDVGWLRARDVVFAVRDGGPASVPLEKRPFLGVVGWGAAGQFPERIFADLLPHPAPDPVSPESPLEGVLERFDRECRSVLPVLSDRGFEGAVTRRSVQEAFVTGGSRSRHVSLERALRRLHTLETYVLRVEALTHDLANAVGSIDGLAELLTQGDEDASAELKWLRSSARHSVLLLQRLREAGADADHTDELVPGPELIEDLARQARALLPANVELSVRNDAPEAQARVDSTDLDRIVANLVVNAREAMPSGGVLTLQLDELRTLEGEVGALRRPIPPGTWTRITVRDTGSGMDASTLRAAFQPRFSTRALHGRGLGLSTVLRLVRRNEGFVRCRSAPEQGTTFEILLPPA